MDWFLWVYAIGAIVTAGMFLAANIVADKKSNVIGIFLWSAVWPVVWVACVAYAVFKS